MILQQKIAGNVITTQTATTVLILMSRNAEGPATKITKEASIFGVGKNSFITLLLQCMLIIRSCDCDAKFVDSFLKFRFRNSPQPTFVLWHQHEHRFEKLL